MLPLLAKCSSKDAKTVYDNLKLGSASTPPFVDKEAVKKALEANYG